jgi:hypothetical protein
MKKKKKEEEEEKKEERVSKRERATGRFDGRIKKARSFLKILFLGTKTYFGG